MADGQKSSSLDASDNKKRNSYADLGLVVAVTLLIVSILRCLIFGISWEDGGWFLLALIYCIISYKCDSESKVVKHSTTAFIFLTIASIVTIIAVDRKPQPKMHAFEGAKVDTVEEEEFVPQEEPDLPAIVEDTTIVPDSTIAPEPDATTAPVEQGVDENVETQEPTTAPAEEKTSGQGGIDPNY